MCNWNTSNKIVFHGNNWMLFVKHSIGFLTTFNVHLNNNRSEMESAAVVMMWCNNHTLLPRLLWHHTFFMQRFTDHREISRLPLSQLLRVRTVRCSALTWAVQGCADQICSLEMKANISRWRRTERRNLALTLNMRLIYSWSWRSWLRGVCRKQHSVRFFIL